MVAVNRWTGVEVRALLQAARMTHADLADQMGISARMVGKWVSGGDAIEPRKANQAALDTVLSRTSVEDRRRFLQATMGLTTIVYDDADTELVSSAAEHPTRRHRVDGRPMTLIEQGIYLAGTRNEPVWLSGFWMDVYPVTNADYARFINASRHRAPAHWVEERFPDQLADHPVVFVTWSDATAYADWAGKSLPSAQQWEKAARGSKGAAYPWGDQQTPFKANVREGRIGHTTPVDRYHSGASPYGVYDMCGNVWEWCSTTTGRGRHELKGSAFTSPFSRAAPSSSNDADESMSDDDTGFRCVTLTNDDLFN